MSKQKIPVIIGTAGLLLTAGTLGLQDNMKSPDKLYELLIILRLIISAELLIISVLLHKLQVTTDKIRKCNRTINRQYIKALKRA